MGSNPYEAPKADLAKTDLAGGAPLLAGTVAVSAPLPPELELKATALLGQKRSRLTGISFAVTGAACVGLMALLTGLVWAFIVGGALAGAISRAYVKSRTERLAEEVCAELGLPPGSFKPDANYLL
jgi:hypothetical protein